nr:DNA polymerase III subunit gamma/tau [Bacilli bacterium]
MSHLALYRQWRPQTFADVVGQHHVVTTLKNAITHQKLAHAYLFAGPRGTGKTTLAKLLAKAINCEQPKGVEPCNECPACVGITTGRVVDVVEMDAASNRGVDEIRSLLEQVRYAPTEVKHKVYIIDEVHMLTTEAFNALLKTLEEPPDYCLFILATTEVHKIPATIVSRCQRFDLNRLSSELIVERLREVGESLEDCQFDDATLWFIARSAEGGLRDALSLFDQIRSFGDGTMTLDVALQVTGGVASERLGQLFSSVLHKEHVTLLSLLAELWQAGVEPLQLIADLIAYTRDAILYVHAVALEDAQNRERYDPAFAVVVKSAPVSEIIVFGERLIGLQAELRYQMQARLYVEVALLALMQEEAVNRGEIARLQARIQALETKIEGFVANTVDTIPREKRASTSAPAPTRPVERSMAMEKAEPKVELKVEPKVQKFVGSLTVHPMNDEEQVLLTSLQAKWGEILEELRAQSVQAKAWLFGSQPVLVQHHQVIVTVKSEVHATTVMQNFRSLVENAMQQRIADLTTLRAITEEGFKQLNWSQEVEESTETATKSREAWVQNVVELFGEDRVIIVEE